MTWGFKIKHPGKLHRELGIPENELIPLSLYGKIYKTPVGYSLVNTTGVGYGIIKITSDIKRDAKRAITMIGWNKPTKKVKKVSKTKKSSKKKLRSEGGVSGKRH